MSDPGSRRWLDAARIYREPRIAAVALLGFSSGLPLLLVFSTLSLWLVDEGISLGAIGLFSLVRTPYTFKFLWAPLIDHVRVPVLARRLGHRRAWALVTQAALIGALLALATTDPSAAPWWTAAFGVLVAFASASQDVVIDAFRIESLSEREQGAGAGAIVLGYRLGMLAAGAGAIWLAAVLPWGAVYALMAALVLVGVVTILAVREPEVERPEEPGGVGYGAWLQRSVVGPFADFMRRPGWAAILAFVMLYKLGDAYLGAMANPFYVAMGFSKPEIASVTKVFGTGATLAGTLLGGALVYRLGILPSLVVCGVAQMLSNLVFAAQAVVGDHLGMLVVTIATENLTGGMATAAFVAYLSSLCNVAYTATQYALLSSFAAFARDSLSATSGFAVEAIGWLLFFLGTTVAALPGLALLVWMIRRFPVAAETGARRDPERPSSGDAVSR